MTLTPEEEKLLKELAQQFKKDREKEEREKVTKELLELLPCINDVPDMPLDQLLIVRNFAKKATTAKPKKRRFWRGRK